MKINKLKIINIFNPHFIIKEIKYNKKTFSTIINLKNKSKLYLTTNLKFTSIKQHSDKSIIKIITINKSIVPFGFNINSSSLGIRLTKLSREMTLLLPELR
jgi:hypothetical protein